MKTRIASSKVVMQLPAEKICQRCDKPFIAEWIGCLKRLSNFCEACKFRNIADSLGLPTHPNMIDIHSTVPTLIEREFKKKLKEIED